MSKPTPDPWRAGIEGNDRIYGPDGMGDHSGPVAEAMHRRDPYERVANKHLIAAAPELLKSLEGFLEWWEYGTKHCCFCDAEAPRDKDGVYTADPIPHDKLCDITIARTAIVKARGENQ